MTLSLNLPEVNESYQCGHFNVLHKRLEYNGEVIPGLITPCSKKVLHCLIVISDDPFQFLCVLLLTSAVANGTGQHRKRNSRILQILWGYHYSDAIISTMASQITSLTIVYSTVYSGVDQRKHQRSASLAFVWVTGVFPAEMASDANVIIIRIINNTTHTTCIRILWLVLLLFSHIPR